MEQRDLIRARIAQETLPEEDKLDLARQFDALGRKPPCVI
jgi:hypothetical protein